MFSLDHQATMYLLVNCPLLLVVTRMISFVKRWALSYLVYVKNHRSFFMISSIKMWMTWSIGKRRPIKILALRAGKKNPQINWQVRNSVFHIIFLKCHDNFYLLEQVSSVEKYQIQCRSLLKLAGMIWYTYVDHAWPLIRYRYHKSQIHYNLN